jgi:hypothetical protein
MLAKSAMLTRLNGGDIVPFPFYCWTQANGTLRAMKEESVFTLGGMQGQQEQ